ncbi:tripartite tricarboxylate transporter permease [Vreelandella venusta]|uniref:Tripartite tricarboxylate transporter permease n=1 Tax=Vreelandella venusta TaxID=44935 RepID=A0AAP9ZEC0_9GAMM|nr:tripartite tricarboxylate transporter permease [Halomonas venusta]MDW0358448.1 tripartite tricarboxylate transporter permease [Halomonas venusta]QRL04183.1 tripartite tricarboxylate transporter permease [Halomonas venusta]WAM49410.1 tripartite tricarboxylate transporter permease [Halomonas venusta]GEK50290.1 C4-dicarboxylate ABC transporter permease [Halomonas venusta]
MTDAFLVALGGVTEPYTLLLMAVATFAGIVAAAIPGFTITMAIVLTLPLTFAMPPMQGIAVMLAVYVGGLSGGLFSAALLGIPGTPSSVATTFDAFPMARQGNPGKALSLGLFASFVGSIISIAVLIVAAPPLALLAVKLGPWEYFALIIFALTVIASLVGDSLLRGLIAGLIGISIATIGPDPLMGRERFTFGYEILTAGIPFLVVLIGMYAMSQLLSELENKGGNNHSSGALISGDMRPHLWQTVKDITLKPINVIRSSLLGVFIGAVPGAGSSISNLLAYDQAKRASKHPETFGKGEPQGVVASESGNSSTVGGSMIPLIALGIPGSPADAVLMAAIMVHGISIGPRLILDHPDLVYSMFIAMAIASVFMLLIGVVLMKAFLRLLNVPKYIVVPVVLACCAIGTYTLNNRLSDLYLLACIGAVGYLLKKLDYPLAPLVLGVVLGPIAETNLRRAFQTSADWTLFFTRPISALLLTLAVASVIYSIYSYMKQRRLMAQRLGATSK